MYFKVDFYFFWRNSQYKNITSFKQSGKGDKIFRHNLYGRQYAEQNVRSYFSFSHSQSKKGKGMSMRREALGPASFIIGPRVLESKNTLFCSLKGFCKVPISKLENRPVAQRRFGITLYKIFSFKSWWQSHHPFQALVEKRSFKVFINKASKKTFLSFQRTAGLFEKENFYRKAIQKERTNNLLSGEVFKESFTDILQTSLEQVGFSLELPSKKSYKPYKATLWKKLQIDTNRRVPYFTRLLFSFRFTFAAAPSVSLGAKVVEPITFDRHASLSPNLCRKNASSFLQSKNHFRSRESLSYRALLQIEDLSNFASNKSSYKSTICTCFASPKAIKSSICKPKAMQSLATIPFLPRVARLCSAFGEAKQIFDLLERGKKAIKYKYKSSYLSRQRLRKLVKATEKKQNKTKISQIKSFHPSPGNYLARGNKQSFKKKQRKGLCPTKLRTYWEYERNKNTKIALTIKIGDYLSSGDKIGESTFCKKKVLHKNKSLSACRQNICLAFRNKVSHSEAMPLCTSSRNFGGKIVSQNKRKGQKISTPIILGSSGRIVTISKTQAIVQKTQPVLFYKSANLHVKKGSWIKQGAPILTLTHQTLITGDIVQGIPRIEQLFEAFTSPPPAFKDKGDLTKFKDGYNTLHSQVRDIFRNNWLKNRLPIAVRKSLEEIGYILVEMIQKVYLSQGVLIADKHIEIIVRQIASKGQILDSGTTGLFLEEVLPVRQIENANLTTPGKKCLYVPAVMGLTAAALNSDSFISAASFQETTRVLSRDAVVGKSDFLRGLKEKVVIGDLISAGTGLDLYFIYTTMLTT